MWKRGMIQDRSSLMKPSKRTSHMKKWGLWLSTNSIWTKFKLTSNFIPTRFESSQVKFKVNSNLVMVLVCVRLIPNALTLKTIYKYMMSSHIRDNLVWNELSDIFPQIINSKHATLISLFIWYEIKFSHMHKQYF